MTPLFTPNCRIDPVLMMAGLPITIDVLRLDLIHPVVSGNKWFKLKYYLDEVLASGKTLLTYGGAYSNHIMAMAAAAKMAGIKSIGVIRGEEAAELSLTLVQAQNLGMRLFFQSRDAYREKALPDELRSVREDLYIIPEGGNGELGVKGAKDILWQNQTTTYSHIISAVGTGTTLAGLAAAAGPAQQVIGISVLKNNYSLKEEVEQWLPADKRKNLTLLHDYHFGGYAKHSEELLRFMNDFYRQTAIPSDFVYTGKTFFATMDLARKQFFNPGARILLLHTGGLQGNCSLPKGTLIFG